jgi:nucleotide-binding universal stress UspA family protein
MKVFWTFDPFEENKTLRKLGLGLLKSIRQASDKVSAVYVASDEELVSARPVAANAGRKFSVVAAEKIKSELSAIGAKGVEISIAAEPRFSLTASVKTLVNHVAKNKVDLLLSSTHGRMGVKRLLLGSFAETLIHFSKTDLLLFNENTKIPAGKPQILLYAHDFSRKGDEGMSRAIEYASAWGSELHVFHAPKPSYAVRFKGQDAAVESYRKKVDAKVEKIHHQLKENGLRGTVSLVTQLKPVIDLIYATARKLDADMVLASAQSGRIAALLGGSVTRQLIREAKIPTLVIKI